MFSLYTFLRCVEFEFLFVPLKMPKLMQVKKKFKSSSPIFLPSASWALLQRLPPLQMAGQQLAQCSLSSTGSSTGCRQQLLLLSACNDGCGWQVGSGA